MFVSLSVLSAMACAVQGYINASLRLLVVFAMATQSCLCSVGRSVFAVSNDDLCWSLAAIHHVTWNQLSGID